MYEQSQLKDYEQPKLLTSDLDENSDALKREINYLINKAKYFKPKTTAEKKKSTTTKTTVTNNEESEEKLDNNEENHEEKSTKDTNEPESKESTEKG